VEDQAKNIIKNWSSKIELDNDPLWSKERVVIYVQFFGTTFMTTLVFSSLIGKK